MKKTFTPLMIFGLIWLGIVIISWFVFPGWSQIPGGFLTLAGLTAFGVITFLKDGYSFIKDFIESRRIIDTDTQQIENHDLFPDNDSHITNIRWSERDQILVSKYFDLCYAIDANFNENKSEAKFLQYCISMGLARNVSGSVFLTQAGALLFCKKQSFPHTKYHIDVTFKDSENDLSNEFSASVLESYFSILELLSPLTTEWRDPTKREKTGQESIFFFYPKTAIIEALVNFFIHRDYKKDDIGYITIYPDRIEFENPGQSLYPVEQLIKATQPLKPQYKRNPRLVQAFRKTGLNQREGRGIIRIKQELEKNGSTTKDGSLGLQIENDLLNDRFRLIIFKKIPPATAIQRDQEAQRNQIPIYKKNSDIHPVGDLPLGSHLPFSPNALFTGREKELKKLADSILGESKTNTVITQAVTGMGGLGKTQLAIEFGYRYGKYFRGVHWINLADTSQLDSEIANCGRQIFTQDFPEDQPSQVALTLQTWKTSGPNLLILDNFEEPSQANHVLTKLRHSNIRILVTSRRTDWSQTLGLTQLPLDLFSEEESLQFLKDSLKDRKDSEDDLKNLAQRLGHLPLGLELASRYLNGYQRLSITDYLKQTQNALDHTSMKNWRADMPAATGHDLDLQRTFALSWEEVKDEIAQKMFMMAGYLASNTPISLEIFERALTISPAECDEALELLYDLGLLRFSFSTSESHFLIIHPLLAEYAQSLAKPDKEILETLANTVIDLSGELNDTGIPANFLSIRPHMPVLAAHAEDAKLENGGGLWNNFAYHLYDIGDYQGAKSAFEHALKVDESNFGADHPNVARDVNNLGGVLKDLGDLHGAKEMFERALKIDESNFGADHPNVAIRVNNLGSVLKDLGDLHGAKEMLELALKIFEANFGADHPNVAKGVNNLGGVLKDLGDLYGAKGMYEHALKIDESNFGADHPNVARDVNNLGGVLKDLGDLHGAKEMFERALKIDESNFGADHPNVAIRVNNLGSVLENLGDLHGAKDMYERALKIDESNFGVDHPKIVIRVKNFGSVLQALDDLHGAKAMFERALKIDEAEFGVNHPNVAIDLSNLGLVLQASGDLHSAKAMFERALKIDEAEFGVNHPNVAIDLSNLGSVLQALGDLHGSKEMFERALKIDEEFFGADHPKVAIRVNNLGSILQALGDLHSAKAMFERALDMLSKSLPSDHPEIKKLRSLLE